MLVILTTHPIQYQVPIWQALARDGRVPFEVWYLTRHGVAASHDGEFGKKFTWDIDMLSGYPHRFLEVAPGATPTTFFKCRLPGSFAQQLHESGAKALWVQGWQVAAYWQAVLAARRAGIEVWLRGESNDLAPTTWWKRPVKQLLLGQLFRRVDRFLYIGTANKRFYRKFGVPEERLHPAPYAVDNGRFARQAAQIRNQKSEIRKSWGISENAFCVLFCGKFILKKRPFDLISAVRILTAANAKDGGKRPVHLLFVGSGELGAQLRDACQVVFDAENSSLSASDGERCVPQLPTLNSQLPPASFTGFLNQTEISKAYVAADCLVLPSDYGETWGLVVNEAMASGMSCVISDRCGCVEDLGQMSSNETFSCGNISVLAEALARTAKRDATPALRVPPGFAETLNTVIKMAALKEFKKDRPCILAMNALELKLQQRPRLLNILHRLYLANPHSQTCESELAAIERHAAGKNRGLEIGTYEGVSAARIASVLSPDGVLYCVDPWPEAKGRPNPCWLITERHLRRTRTWERIKILRGFSGEVKQLIPSELDFAFIDGDHSWEGIKTDWEIVQHKLSPGGIVCLHDTLTPTDEPWRKLDSMRFFQEVIAPDPAFEVVEQVHSLTVLRKR